MASYTKIRQAKEDAEMLVEIESFGYDGMGEHYIIAVTSYEDDEMITEEIDEEEMEEATVNCLMTMLGGDDGRAYERNGVKVWRRKSDGTHWVDDEMYEAHFS